MEKTEKNGGADIPKNQEEFNEMLDGYMAEGDEEALFYLLEKCPGFTRRYAREVEKECGL